MAKKIVIAAPGAWTFEDNDVAQGFDGHVRQQLPWYDLATGSVASIVRHYLPEGGRIYDLGAATGNIGRALAPLVESRRADFIPIEASREMARRYEGPGRPRIERVEDFDFQPFDVAISFLTTIFVPVDRRRGMISRLFSKRRRGGVVVFVEKTEPIAGYAGSVLYRLTLDGKRRSGATPEEILDKELALSGVQRPMSANELGPHAVEFFRFGDFVGWLVDQR